MFSLKSKWRGFVLLAAAVIALTPLLTLAYDWPQFDGSSQHSGNNTQETVINLANVNTLQQKFQITLPVNVTDGQPMYVSNVTTNTGTVNMLFVTTEDGHLTALNADNGAVIWVRPIYNGPDATQPRDLTNEYTTSSPALDPNYTQAGHQFIYSYDPTGYVHKYTISDGLETITTSWPETATLKPLVEKGSAALATAIDHSGTLWLYVANSGYPGDSGDYQGHITTINLNTGSQNVFNANCSNLTIHFVLNGTPGVNDCAAVQSAIWGRPAVIYDPDTDKIYASTSNGDFNGNAHGYDWGDTVLELNPDGTGANGKPLDSYTPDDYQYLDTNDLDLGSVSPALISMPVTSTYQHVAAQGGKDGIIRLINLDNMGGGGGPGNTGHEIQNLDALNGSEILPQPAVWINPSDQSRWLFVSSDYGLDGMQIVYTGTVPGLRPRWHIPTLSSSPLLANGVLFAATRNDNAIYAYNPINGTAVWSGTIGTVHWQAPMVANGVLYMPDLESHIIAFGLPNITPSPTPAPTTPTPTDCPNPFVDVSGNVFYGAIHYLNCRGVINGQDATHYAPGGTATRAQFAKIVVLGFGVPLSTPAQPTFSDVPASYYAYVYIESGYAQGILSGFDQNTCQAAGQPYPCYLPNNSITRGQLTKLVVNAAHYTPYTPSGGPDFSDVPSSNVFYVSIETAYHVGVINGYADHTFRPNNNIRRDEMAQIVYEGIINQP